MPSQSKKGQSNRKATLSPEQRRRRIQQIVFAAMAIVLIISWIVSLVVIH